MNDKASNVNRNIEVYKDGAITLEILADREAKEVWLTRRQIAELLGLDVRTIGNHLDNYKTVSPEAKSTVRNILSVGEDGKKREIEHCSMDAVMYIAYRAQSTERVWAFRQWASGIITRYVTGDLRDTEKHTYEGVKDLISRASDYDPSSDTCRLYFATYQNKLLYAVSGQTAAGLKASRADHQQPNMGLQNFSGQHVVLSDALTSKNYLTRGELERLQALVSTIYTALPLFWSKPATMQEWMDYIDNQIKAVRLATLMKYEGYTRDQADAIVRREYDAFKRLLKNGE